MNCKYFAKCGGCANYKDTYQTQLDLKVQKNKTYFIDLYNQQIDVFSSLDIHYRARAEFKIWHDNGDIEYAMHFLDNKGYLVIDKCPQVASSIYELMPKLLIAIKRYKLKDKLFGVDFLSSTNGDIVVSLLYHKKIDEIWENNAKTMAQELDISVIRRSKKQKIIIKKDYVIEYLHVNNRIYNFMQIENSFTQPNPRVNEKMIGWILKQSKVLDGDLLELYCGAGNFTIPLADNFHKILATEISKTSINAAKENMRLNSVTNIEFLRMSSEELVQALDKVRVFRRMKDININLYNIKTVFVDPPRAGLDELTCKFISRYDNILYISCNPITLKRDLEFLNKIYKVTAMALFDQFAYTNHVEMGVRLQKR